MAGGTVFSPADEGLSPNSGIEITMEEGSDCCQELLDDGDEEFEIETNDLDNEDNQILEVKNNNIENAIHQLLGTESIDFENNSEQALDIHSMDPINESDLVLEFENNDNSKSTADDNAAQNNCTQDKSYPPPVEGMEFESYDDAYNHYNGYAMELGFGIRVKSSWTKRNSKEKRGAVLCCNCEGFKTMKEASVRRKETRTGCLAMIKLRLVESNRWRLDEVKLEHNHLFDHQKARNSRSHKKTRAGAKRKLESSIDLEVQTIKLYRMPAIDSLSYGSSNERELNSHIDQSKCSKIKNGDVEAIHNYFRRAQLADPNFFYVMDLNDEGYLRNVFWIDSRSRAAYGYFGDVVVVDTNCLSNKNDNIPVLSFSGLNHHCHSVLLGCGLIVDESIEAYVWLMRAWLTCMCGRTPQTIITANQCKALQCAISEVFPRALLCLCLSLVMSNIYEKLEKLGDSEIFRTVLNRTVYDSMKIEEFEMGWEEMIQHFGLKDQEWLRRLYEDRERWVPVYLKSTFLAGIHMNIYFHGYLHNQITLNEFFNTYELIQQKMVRKEALDDYESRESTPALRTSCNYEFPVSQVYTNEIFLKFQEEVVLMSSCVSVTQAHANGPLITYTVKEQGAEDEAKNFEVLYDKVGIEVRCICGCFNLRGYLCRHALSVLNYNGVEEIPSQYILSRWRKDIKRLYSRDFGSNNIDISNPVQWYEHLYRRAMQVVTEGMASKDHQMVAWQALKESVNKVRLVAEKHL